MTITIDYYCYIIHFLLVRQKSSNGATDHCSSAVHGAMVQWPRCYHGLSDSRNHPRHLSALASAVWLKSESSSRFSAV